LQNLHSAKWWKAADNGIRCLLCPRNCLIIEGCTGFCKVRKNIAGRLYALAYGRPVALQVDPIEKKPLAEFLPGTQTFSLGTYGCNLSCLFCQNHHLSRGSYQKLPESEEYSPATIIKLTQEHNCQSVAFTYNEPIIWSEYIIDIAKLAKKAGLATVLVSNAYVSKNAAEEVFPYIDAANFDMKGFSEEFYKDMTGGHLQAILNNIEYFYSLHKHIELTNLIIPEKNDSDKMIDNYLLWIGEKLDKKIPLHFSAYHPDYQFNKSPHTPPELLYRIKNKAGSKGFAHVYLGNI